MKRHREDTSPPRITYMKSDSRSRSKSDPAVPHRVELGVRIAKLCAALDVPPDSQPPDPAVLPILDSDPLSQFWETRPIVPISNVLPHSSLTLPKEASPFPHNIHGHVATRAPPPRPKWMGLKMASQVQWVWISSSHGQWYGIM